MGLQRLKMVAWDNSASTSLLRKIILRKSTLWYCLLPCLFAFSIFGAHTAQAQTSDECYSRGAEQYQNRNYAEAVEAYTCAINRSSGEPLYWAVRGQAHLANGSLDEAISDLTQAETLSTRNEGSNSLRSFIYETRGLAYSRRGSGIGQLDDLQAAINDFYRAVLLGEPTGWVYYQLAAAYAALRDYPSAIDYYTQAIQFDYGPLAYYWRADAYSLLRNYHAAIADQQIYTALEPERFNGWYWLGRYQERDARYADAVLSFEQALAINPQNAWANYFMGWVLGNVGRYDDAITYFEIAQNLSPDNSTFYYGPAMMYQSTGRYTQDMVEGFQRYLELTPDRTGAYWLAYATFKAGDRDTGLQLMTEIDSTYTPTASQAWTRTFMRYVMGDFTGALDELAEYIRRVGAENATSHLYHGLIYRELGDEPLATQYFERHLESLNTDIAKTGITRNLLSSRANALALLGDMEASARDYLDYLNLMDHTITEVDPMEIGDTRDLHMVYGTTYAVPLLLTGNDVIDITVFSATDNVDTIILLLDSDGNPLAGNDDADLRSLTYGSALSNIIISQGEKYVLLVTHGDGRKAGMFTIALGNNSTD